MNISLLVGGLDCFGFRSHNICEYCNQVPVTCVRAAVLTALFLPSQHPFRMDGGMEGWIFVRKCHSSRAPIVASLSLSFVTTWHVA